MFDQSSWNEHVKYLGGSFLQSWEWGALQENLGNKIIRLSGTTYAATLIIKNLPLGWHYLYAPYGPIAENIDSLKLFLEEIKNSCREFMFVRLEPQSYAAEQLDKKKLLALGLKPGISLSPQPHTTLQLDLCQDEADILHEMEYETRYAIKTAEKRGVTIITSRDIGTERAFLEFWNLFLKNNSRHNLRAHVVKYYESIVELNGSIQTEIFLAKFENKTIATAIILFFNKTAVYLYAASEAGFGKYNAPSLLLWRALQAAKSRKYTKFDFWGISSDKSWEGITKFKKSFGGKEVNYAGSWDMPINKSGYLLYSMAKKIL